MQKKNLAISVGCVLGVLCIIGIGVTLTRGDAKPDASKDDTQQEQVTETFWGGQTELGTEILLETETLLEIEMNLATETEGLVATEVAVENETTRSGTNEKAGNSESNIQSSVGGSQSSSETPKVETSEANSQTQKPEASSSESTSMTPTQEPAESETPTQKPVESETPTQQPVESESTTPALERGAYLVKGQDISNASLSEGDAMYDVSITTINGETLKLSDILQEKDMVMLNFWFINCYWCDYEFNYMSPAYQSYKNDVEIIAVNAWDSLLNIQTYATQKQLPFKVAQCPYSWVNAFGVTGCPTTVIIDRYGTICEIEVGAITSVEGFTSIFEQYIGDDYQP